MNTQLYNLYLKYPQVITDSREAGKGKLFFALKGDRFDGNQFAHKALEAGCERAIVDDPSVVKNKNYLLVENVLATLQQLASHHRKASEIPVIAITGTNGKTTTKELTAAVLAQKHNVHYTRGNLNNHIGVPLTLLQLQLQHDIAIIEMGANHPGEITALCKIADPDFGLITNIGKAHLEGFGSFNRVIDTKRELYRHIENKKGKIFINSNNPILTSIAGDIEKITYGTQGENYLSGEHVKSPAYCQFKALFSKGWLFFRTQLIGDYNFENCMAATCIGRFFDVDPPDIQKAIAAYKPTNLRSQLIKGEHNTIILDAYNANPTSMEASIRNFISMNHKNSILILGDMLELGKYSTEEHQKIIDLIKESPLRQVFLVGNCFGKSLIPNGFTWFETTIQLQEFLSKNPVSNATILIKGSRGIKLEILLDDIT